MKIEKKVFIYKLILLSIITILVFGISLYFVFIFTKNDKVQTIDNKLPSKQLEGNLNLTNENSNYQTFSEKNYPSSRNGYNFDCNFTYDGDQVIIQQNENSYEEDIICLFIKDTKTNNFPIIIFKNLLDELNPLPINAYEYINNTISVKSSYVTDIENSKRENRARVYAKEISGMLLDSLAFDSRLILLDKVIFEKTNNYNFLLPYELGSYNVSNNDYITHSSYLEQNIKANERTINLYIKPYNKRIIINEDNSLEFETTKNNGLNKNISSLQEVGFDVLETLYVFAKQYGKFLFSLIKPSSLDLLSILDPFFKTYEEKKQFSLHYNYFNSLNKSENLNYSRRENKDLDLSIYDRNILNNFRKFFSYSTSRLLDEFSNYSEDINWQKNTEKKLKYGLLHNTTSKTGELNLYERQKYPLPQQLEEFASGALITNDENKLINKTEYDKFYSHIISEGYLVYVFDVESSFSFSSVAKRSYSDKLYYLMSVNYPPTSSSSLLVGDIFPSQKLINLNTTYEDSSYLKATGTGCLAQPLNFITLSSEHFESRILRRVVQNKLDSRKVAFSNLKYSELSKSIDKETLKTLSNFFSIKEIFSSLFAIYSFKYSDRRNTINSCKYNYDYENNNGLSTYSIVPVHEYEMFQFNDYLFFSIFKIQLLGGQTERKIYNNLFGYKLNDGKLFSYNALLYEFKQKEYNVDAFKIRHFAYSFNEVTYSNKELRNWSIIYLPLLIKLEDYKNGFLLEIKANLVKYDVTMNTISYDYNNLYINTSNLDRSSIDDKSIFKQFIYDDYRNKKKYVGVVIKLGFIYGQYEPFFDLKGVKSLNEAEEIFANINDIYIDKNGNRKFDSTFEDTFIFITHD